MEIFGTFYFDPEDKIYGDHFPGTPVVPGSVIIHAFLRATQQQFKSFSELMTVQDFRFKTFVSPGAWDYSLDRKENHVSCRLLNNGTSVVSGRICL